MKKSLIFWFAAVTCAALFLVGCESPTNGDAGAAGANAPGTLPSGATPAMLAALFETTDTVIVGLPLGEGTFTVPAGKTLAVAGTVDITGANTVINAFDGTLDVSAGGFTADEGNVFIVAEAAAAAVKAAAPSGIVPAYVASIPATPSAITEDVVLPGLSIGGSGTSAANFGIFAGTSNTVYVAGDVTIDATTTPFNTGSAKITVLGNTTAKGNLTVGGTAALGKLTASGPLTLSGVSQAEELDTGTYTVTAATDTTVELDSLDSSTGGKLELKGDVTKVDIKDGTGNIEFNTGTPAFASTASSFGNTGLTTFKANATTTTGITFDGRVVFEGNLTVTGDTVTFNDTAFFKNSVVVTLADTSSAITLAGVTGALAVGAPVANVPDIYSTVLIGNDASTGGTLTATAADTTLTFATGGITQGGTAKGIEITGKVAAIPAKSYTVAVNNTLKVDTNNELALDAGVLANYGTAPEEGKPAKESDWVAKLVLTADDSNGALLTGAGKVVAGGAAISGGTSGWKAVGSAGTVTIAKDAITASADTAVLTAVTGGTQPSITVAAGATLGIAADTTIALEGTGTAVGSITLTGDSTNPGKLTFTNVGSGDVGTSLITTGQSGTNKIADVTKVAVDGVGVAIVGYFDNASIGSATKFAKLGASNTTNSITAGGDGEDVVISGKDYSAGDFGST